MDSNASTVVVLNNFLAVIVSGVREGLYLKDWPLKEITNAYCKFCSG